MYNRNNNHQKRINLQVVYLLNQNYLDYYSKLYCNHDDEYTRGLRAVLMSAYEVKWNKKWQCLGTVCCKMVRIWFCFSVRKRIILIIVSWLCGKEIRSSSSSRTFFDRNIRGAKPGWWQAVLFLCLKYRYCGFVYNVHHYANFFFLNFLPKNEVPIVNWCMVPF